MARIKRIDEMSNNKKYTLRGLVLGTELDGKYMMTDDGLKAVYHALYNGEDVDGAIEFAEYAAERINKSEFEAYISECIKPFIYDKLSDDASYKKILDTIYDGDYLNYLSPSVSAFEEFDNGNYTQWAYEVANLIGLGKYYEEN